MSIRERVVHELDRLSEPELKQVADYVAYLKLRAKLGSRRTFDESQWAALYGDCAAEDRALAEEGISDYNRGLNREDAR